MLRCLVAFPLFLATTPATAAPAELALGEAQLQLLPRADIFDEATRHPVWWRAAGFAQVIGGGEGGGDIGAGAALAVSGIGCDLVDAAAQGRVRPFADDVVVGDARYSICLSRMLLTLAFDGRRGFGLAPSISQRASLWRRRYTSEFDRVSIAFGELWGDDETSRHTILSIVIGHGTTTQLDAMETRTIKELELDVAVYRYRDVGKTYDASLEVAALTSNAMKAGTTNEGGVTSAFYPARLRVESPTGMFGSVRAGWGFTGGTLSASGSTEVDGETVDSWSETIDSAGLPSMTTPVGELVAGVRLPARRFAASATASRNFYPTFDGNFALEDRLAATATIGIVRGPGTPSQPVNVSLSPFTTKTKTWTRDDGTSTDRSYGAALQVGRDLSKLLRVDGIGELGRSPYARLDDGGRAPTSTFGGQLLVALSARTQR